MPPIVVSEPLIIPFLCFCQVSEVDIGGQAEGNALPGGV